MTSPAAAPVLLVALITEVDDSRQPQEQSPSMESTLLIAIPTAICGTDSWTEVEFFGRRKQAWLESSWDLWHGLPSHDTFGRVFGLLNPHNWKPALRRGCSRSSRLCGTGSWPWTARRSGTFRGMLPLHLMRGWT